MKKCKGIMLMILCSFFFLLAYGRECEAAMATKHVSTSDDLRKYVKVDSDLALILDKDITMSQCTEIKGKKEIRGNGHKIIRGSSFHGAWMFYVKEGLSLTLRDLTIDGANVRCENGIINVKQKGTLTIINSTIKNSKPTLDGGAISNTGVVIMKSGTITNCSTQACGGAIYNYKTGEFRMEGGTIQNNYAKNNGGAVFIGLPTKTQTSAKISGGVIKGNTCGGKGSAIYCGNVTVLKTPTINTNNDMYIPCANGLKLSQYTGTNKIALNMYTNAFKSVVVAGTSTLLSKVCWSSGVKNSANMPLMVFNNNIIIGRYVTLNYHSEGGTNAVFKSTKVLWGSACPTMPTLQKTGYKFVGWTIGKGSTTYFKAGNKVALETGSYELYPSFTPLSFNVTFDSMGGSKVSTVKQVTYDKVFGAMPVSTRTGYTFQGWYSKDGKTNYRETTVCKLLSNTVLYAKWSANKVKLKFDCTGGTNVADKTITYGQNPDLTVTSSRTGYYFKGWYLETSCKTKAEAATLAYSTKDVTVYAKWEPIKVKLSFDCEGGTQVADMTITYDQKPDLTVTTSKTGYHFKGWYLDSSFKTKADAEKLSHSLKDVTVYAKWEAIKVKLTFESSGGTKVPSKTITYDQKLDLTQTSSRYGYDFAGWYLEPKCANKVDPEKLAHSLTDVTVFAKWTAKQYAVKFVAAGGNAQYSLKQVIYNQKIGALPTTSRQGYLFQGWYTKASGGVKVTSDYLIQKDREFSLYAHWVKNDVTSLSIVTMKHTYYAGKNIGTKDITLKAVFRDGNVKTIKSGYTIKKYSNKVGKRTITIQYMNKRVTTTCTWYDKKKLNSMKLKQSKATVYVGDKKRIQVQSAYGITEGVSYKSSNSKVVAVSKTGECTAKKSGKATIKVTITINGHKKTLSYTMKVKKPELKIIVGTKRIKNNSVSFKTTKKGVKGNLTWSISNSKVGTIDKKTGNIKIKNSGVTYVTAKAKGVTCKIKIRFVKTKKNIQYFRVS